MPQHEQKQHGPDRVKSYWEKCEEWARKQLKERQSRERGCTGQGQAKKRGKKGWDCWQECTVSYVCRFGADKGNTGSKKITVTE